MNEELEFQELFYKLVEHYQLAPNVATEILKNILEILAYDGYSTENDFYTPVKKEV